MSTTTTVPVNPLTGELTTVTVINRRHPGGTANVQGRIVAPGLALTPFPQLNPKEPARYCLTHIATGLAVIPGTCGVHALKGVETATSVDVDWTITDKDAMVAAIKAHDGFMGWLSSLRFDCSGRWCTVGDGPEPVSWDARCLTCGWQWDEYNDWPLTREEAATKAEEHQCEPEVELRSPETGDWAELWTFEPSTPDESVQGIGAVAS
jgi:hypothetical protein